MRIRQVCFSLCLITLVLVLGVQADEKLGSAPSGFEGRWYALLKTPAGEIPFELKLQKQGDRYSGELEDGHYHTALQDFKLEGGHLSFGIDDARVRFELEWHGEQLEGMWTRAGKTTAKLPFTVSRTPLAPASQTRAAADFAGEWHCVAKEENGTETPITLIVRIEGARIEGTGIDPTGDFGEMSGRLLGDQLALSRFDGQSISLVVASLEGDRLRAAVSTSPYSQFTITGARRGALLPDPASVAKVSSGLNFSFPDLAGKQVGFPSDQFKGKVVVIDIMGTWCHNCHDETPFLIELYNKYHARGLEIVSLCFEAQANETEDRRAIERYQRSRNIPYTMLYAGRVEGGGPAKAVAGLEQFGGYPTNIFIGRDGRIASTHTGFWGPATGEKYLIVKRDFEETIKRLLDN